MTTLDQRNLQVLTLVYRFQQLTTKQIHDLLFHDNTTMHPVYNALDKLVDRGWLTRINRLKPGGAKGGSGQYVYAITRAGWQQLHVETPFRRIGAENLHTLAIAETFVGMVKLERAGRLKIDGYATEPETHVIIGAHYLKPDLYVELSSPRPLRLMFEIDMDTQSDKQLMEKLERYWGATIQDGYEWPSHQGVVFVAVSDERAAKLKRLVGKLAEDKRNLFLVWTQGQFAASL